MNNASNKQMELTSCISTLLTPLPGLFALAIT